MKIFREEFFYFVCWDGFEDIGSTAREKSIDDSKTRILRGRTDERDDTFLHPRKQDVLLRLGPAMDLIQK